MKSCLCPLYASLAIFVISFLECTDYAFAQPGPAPVLTTWRSLGSSGDDEFRSMWLTSDGGCIVSGFATAANGDVSVNLGQLDYWIVKLDSNFTIEWQQVLGGTARDWARDIRQTSDGGYTVLGQSASHNGQVTGNHGNFDYWLVKLNHEGVFQWQKSMGGSALENAYTARETSDGGYICSGFSFSNDGDVTGNHGKDDGWVVKLDAARNIQWQRSFGGSETDQIDDVILTPDSGYLLVAFTASVNGDVTFNHGGYDLWLIKLNSSGTIEWQKTYGGTKDDAGREGIPTSDGGYIIAGYSGSNDGDATINKGSLDFWIIKIDSSGTLQWQKSLGSSMEDYAFNIMPANDGNYLIAGFSGASDGDAPGNHGKEDGWLIKIDGEGTLLWEKNLGGSLDDVARSCAQRPDGSIYVAGFTMSSDGDVLGQHGVFDGWVAKVCFMNTFFADHDHDGFGSTSEQITGCSAPANYVSDNTDCNDADSGIFPGATETCNSVDDNCNGQADEGFPKTWHPDNDGDGFGNSDSTLQTCTPPVGYIADGTDCDDADVGRNPSATEICNSIDDNCNGQVDENLQGVFYADSDLDGFGNPGVTACTPTEGFVSDAGDCNDSNQEIHPGAVETCNGIDDDCNGQTDGGLQFTFYADADGDGYGTSTSSVLACSSPAGYVSDHTDCNDVNNAIHPNVADLCNGIDDNCSGAIDENAISAIVTPAGSVATCAGSEITLTANTGSAITYQWKKGNSNIAGATNSTYSTSKAGSYKVSESNSFNCSAVSAVTTITAATSPSAIITPLGNLDICSTGSVVLQANAGTGFTYQWVKGSNNISGATNQTYTAVQKATYKVLVTNSGGCSKLSAGAKVTKSCKEGEMDPIVASQFSIYPNPANSQLFVEYLCTTSGKVQFTVYNMLGTVEFSRFEIAEEGITSAYQFNLSNLPSGVYMLEARNGMEVVQKKFVLLR